MYPNVDVLKENLMDIYSHIDQPTIPSLPDAVISPRVDFKWHSDLEIDSKTFITNVSQAYSEIVHWQENLFMLPSWMARHLYFN